MRRKGCPALSRLLNILKLRSLGRAMTKPATARKAAAVQGGDHEPPSGENRRARGL